MKKLIIGITIATSTVVIPAFPQLTNMVNIVALLKFDSVKYQAVKVDNSIDAMLNPEQGGVRPMPPPPRWIPPVSEDMMNKMPPSSTPKLPAYGNYTPMRHLPPSPPWMIPTVENDGKLKNKRSFPIR